MRSLRSRETLTALLFILPAIAALGAFRLVPALWLVVTSLSSSSGKFVGLANFEFLYSLPSFGNTVRATLTFVAVTVPFQTVIAFALALLFTNRMPGVGLFRVLVFLPVAVPGAVSAILWGAAFRPDGLANAILGLIGVPVQPFLTSPDQALLSIVVLTSWIGVGFWMVFLIGGLKDIPHDLYEASAIDGLNAWSTLWRITIPLMRRPLAFVIVADTVAAFLLFAPVAILTRGGPSGSTQLVMFDVYQQAYIFDDVPLAAAEALTILVIIVAVVLAQFRLLSRTRG
jgi:multiple sugar transport system permease protein